jgi:hypothetical protein
MTDLATQITIERLVLDGIALPEDDLARFPLLLESELDRLLESGRLTPPAAPFAGATEARPLILSSPPDVSALARDVAERIVDAVAAGGAWNG